MTECKNGCGREAVTDVCCLLCPGAHSRYCDTVLAPKSPKESTP